MTAFGGELMNNFVDEGFESNDIRQKLAFVALVGRHTAGFIDLDAKE